MTTWSSWLVRFFCACGRKYNLNQIQEFLVCPSCGENRARFRQETYRFKSTGSFFNPTQIEEVREKERERPQPSGVGEPQPTEMRLCEINHLFLHPNQLYRFTVDENCAACVAYSKTQPLVAAREVGEGLREGLREAAPIDLKVPFQKPLTVLLMKDRSEDQASADVAEIKKNDRIVLRVVSEMYFHQLRLECAKDPSLLDKIAVFYRDKRDVLHSIGLSFEDELRWPPGFLQEAWSLEAEISKVRHPALAAPAPKPAPPAEPQIYAMCICSGYHDDGWVNPNCPVHGTLRRAAERKPPR